MTPRRFAVAAILLAALLMGGAWVRHRLDGGSGAGSAAGRCPLCPTSDEVGAFPPLLSQAGVFKEAGTLEVVDRLIPYELNVPFWSDGADKGRWIELPQGGKIGFSAMGAWSFPAGTRLVKHFELPADGQQSGRVRRLETRILVVDDRGEVHGATYRWRADGGDAEIVRSSLLEPVQIRTEVGPRTQRWFYPGPEDCRTCHTAAAGGVLGLNTRQLNRDVRRPDGSRGNQLLEWSKRGLFSSAPDAGAIGGLPKLASAADASASTEQRARSYLDVNCAQCHRPGGAVADFDARFETPPARQEIVDAPARIDLGIDRARLIAPNDPWRSILLARVETLEPTLMPPLGRQTVDEQGVKLLRAWIGSMAGPPVLAPPRIEPGGGEFASSVRIGLKHDDPSAVIRYTLDGSSPGKSAAVYEGPIELRSPATVRARAYRDGHTRSIAAQETFIVSPPQSPTAPPPP